MENYKTVANEATAEYTEKRSRFIAQVRPVHTEDEALAFLAEVRARHPQARHNVYAYVVRENNQSRYSDDGEPSGTAGLPLLNVLTKQNLTDVALVVTRYFGGILLGAGGLARAYGKSAAEGVLAATPVSMVHSQLLSVSFAYPLLGKIQHILGEGGFQIIESSFGVQPALTVCTEASRSDVLYKTLIDAAGGKVDIEALGTRFVPVPLPTEVTES